MEISIVPLRGHTGSGMAFGLGSVRKKKQRYKFL